MSKLREAAQDLVDNWSRRADMWEAGDLVDRLRAALAEPETEAQPVVEPVAWEARWIDPEEGPSDWVPTQNPDFYRSRPNYEVRPLYANPPSDDDCVSGERALRAAIAQHVAEAVAAEREECARIMEAQDIDPSFRNRMVTAIRARAGHDEVTR